MNAVVAGWLATLLLVVTTAVWFRAARRVALVGSRAPYVLGWAGSAVLGALSLSASPGSIGAIPAGFAIAAGGFLLVLVAISPQRAAPDAVRVGMKLPDFTAPDDDARPFTLSGLEGRPILLKFFRGHW